MQRADKYTGDYQNLIEVLIFGKIPMQATTGEYQKLAEDLFNSFFDIKYDPNKQTVLLNQDVTHMGVSCGC